MAADDEGLCAPEPDGHPTPPGANDELDVALLRLCRLITAVTLRAGTARHPPLSLSQIRTLTALAAVRDGLSLGQLSAFLVQKPPAVTSLGSLLVESGLVARTAGPGSEIRLSLLPAGVQLLAAVNRDRLDRLRELLETLPTAERSVVLEALARFGTDSAGHEELW